MSRRYEFAPGLRLSLEGNGTVLRHFDAEYKPASIASSGPAEVEVRFGPPGVDEPGVVLQGGHKTVSWHITLSPPQSERLRASIWLRGRPRSFALSLVQGYVVEPLVSLAAARRGRVLLPAAAFSEDGNALILLGRSRSGKSSLAVIALSTGRTVLGDDQILLEEPSCCRPFPRRLRLYPDIARTAPAGHAALSLRHRRGLDLLRAADMLSRGYVRQSIRVQPTELGVAGSSPLPVGRIVLLERGGAGGEISVDRLDGEVLVEAGAALLAEQRRQLETAADEGWGRALAAAAEAEEVTLRRVLERASAERITLPAAWDAARAIGALAERFRLRTA